MIPAEAVEAAAKALAIQAWGQWEYVPNELRKAFIRDAKITLEAAAPYMLAGAWGQGYKAGLFDKEYYSHNPNPYMLNNEGEK